MLINIRMNKIITLISLKKDTSSILIIIFLSILLISPFFNAGFFPTHDGEWAVVRLADMYRELRDFQIPPRLSGNLNFGYGYPLFNFAYPLPYYFGFILKIIGFGFVDSIKLLFAMSVPMSGIGMYFLGKNIWSSRFSGIISAVLYMFLPYRLVDLYVRGSLGESLSFIYFPFIILCFYKIFHNKNIRLYALSLSFLVAFLIMTHNIMAVLFAPIIFICLLVGLIFKKYPFLFISSIGSIAGVCMSAFFWVPALFEKQFVSLSKIPIADRSLYFVNPLDLLNSPWGYGIPTDSNAFTYQIGHAHLIGIIVAFVIALYTLRKRERSSIIVVSITACMFLYTLMLFRSAHVIWRILPLFREINYPWTMLSVIGFLTSLLIGFLGRLSKVPILGFVFILFAILSLLPFAHPKEYVNRGDDFYLTNDATTTSSNEFMPLWVKEKPNFRFLEKAQITRGEGIIKDLVLRSNQISFSTDLKNQATVRINTIYYPGWRAYVDNKEESINYSNKKGLMEIVIPQETKNVEFIFGETGLRLFANFLSAVSFIVVSSFALYSLKHGQLLHSKKRK